MSVQLREGIRRRVVPVLADTQARYNELAAAKKAAGRAYDEAWDALDNFTQQQTPEGLLYSPDSEMIDGYFVGYASEDNK